MIRPSNTWVTLPPATSRSSGGTFMRTVSTRLVTACVVLSLVGAACGKDRSATPASSAPVAAATTTAPAGATTAVISTTSAATGSSTPAGSSAATTSPGTVVATTTSATTTSTGSSTGSSTSSSNSTTTTAPVAKGPMFGDAPWPCSAGTTPNTDTGTEVGVTAKTISIAGGDDAGYAGAPGLDHEITDAMKALVTKCNSLGGINGRQITFNYYDAALLNVGPAIQSACDDKNFFLVGEGWAFDSNQEETRLACGLPAVPAYSTSAAFAMGKDVYVGVPNPADETPAGIFAQTTTLLGAAVQHVGPLVGNFSATQELRDKVVAAASAFGWGFSETKLEYSITGETDWTPFVKQLQDAGTTAVYWSGSCLPNLQLFAQAAKANAFNVPKRMTRCRRCGIP